MGTRFGIRLTAIGDGGRSTVAQRHPDQADDLDADPYLLNCQNGVLDLRTST